MVVGSTFASPAHQQQTLSTLEFLVAFKKILNHKFYYVMPAQDEEEETESIVSQEE